MSLLLRKYIELIRKSKVMGKYSDVFQVVSSYGMDDFNYQEISDNERITEVNHRWGFISEINKQCSGIEIKDQDSESADVEPAEERVITN